MTITINHFKTRVIRYPLLTVCLSCALITTGLNADLNKSEWAYWVQAIGSVGAIAAAIWLATRENIRRYKDSYELARFTAAGIQLPLSNTNAVVGALGELLDKHASGLPPLIWIKPISYQELEKIGKAVAAVRTWSPEELHSLVVFPDRCADKLNTAFGIIEGVTNSLTGYDIFGDDETLLKQAALESAKSLKLAHTLISQALNVIRTEAAFAKMD